MKNLTYAVMFIVGMVLLLAFMGHLDHPDRVFDEDKIEKKVQAHKLANSLQFEDLRKKGDAMLWPVGAIK